MWSYSDQQVCNGTQQILGASAYPYRLLVPWWSGSYTWCKTWRISNNGRAPILLALGAMSFKDKPEKDKLDMFVKGFEKTGNKAIIQGFNKTLDDYNLLDSMIAIGSVPHSYLFDMCKMVIHHCGFGTSAATLFYGIPSIPVPHVLDQNCSPRCSKILASQHQN